MNKNVHFGHVLHFCELTYERDRVQRVKIGGLQPEFALYQIVSKTPLFVRDSSLLFLFHVKSMYL
jgi:hypothetical protein